MHLVDDTDGNTLVYDMSDMMIIQFSKFWPA